MTRGPGELQKHFGRPICGSAMLLGKTNTAPLKMLQAVHKKLHGWPNSDATFGRLSGSNQKHQQGQESHCEEKREGEGQRLVHFTVPLRRGGLSCVQYRRRRLRHPPKSALQKSPAGQKIVLTSFSPAPIGPKRPLNAGPLRRARNQALESSGCEAASQATASSHLSACSIERKKAAGGERVLNLVSDDR
jgi:hypothetical protein